jgi:hypothetical protein
MLEETFQICYHSLSSLSEAGSKDRFKTPVGAGVFFYSFSGKLPKGFE